MNGDGSIRRSQTGFAKEASTRTAESEGRRAKTATREEALRLPPSTFRLQSSRRFARTTRSGRSSDRSQPRPAATCETDRPSRMTPPSVFARAASPPPTFDRNPASGRTSATPRFADRRIRATWPRRSFRRSSSGFKPSVRQPSRSSRIPVESRESRVEGRRKAEGGSWNAEAGKRKAANRLWLSTLDSRLSTLPPLTSSCRP